MSRVCECGHVHVKEGVYVATASCTLRTEGDFAERGKITMRRGLIEPRKANTQSTRKRWGVKGWRGGVAMAQATQGKWWKHFGQPNTTHSPVCCGRLPHQCVCTRVCALLECSTQQIP
jgi:hypothetical protein